MFELKQEQFIVPFTVVQQRGWKGLLFVITTIIPSVFLVTFADSMDPKGAFFIPFLWIHHIQCIDKRRQELKDHSTQQIHCHHN